MDNVILVGAGGLAVDLYSYIGNSNCNLKGVLVDYKEHYNKSKIEEKYLGKIKEYKIEVNDIFLIAIGENPGRRKIINYFKTKKARFFTYVHPSAIIHPTAVVEEGCIVGPFSIIGSNAKIGKNTFINKFCNIGHDAVLEDDIIMYPYSMVGGWAKIGKNTVISTRSTIIPNCTVGSGCTISGHSFIKKDLKNDTFIFNKETLITKMKKYDE